MFASRRADRWTNPGGDFPGLRSFGAVIGVLVFFFKRLRVPAGEDPWRRCSAGDWPESSATAVSSCSDAGSLRSSRYRDVDAAYTFFLAPRPWLSSYMAFLFGFITVLYGLAWSFGARDFGEEHLPGWLGMPALYYRDAFWIGVGGSAALIGLRRLLDFVAAWWPTLHRELPRASVISISVFGAGRNGSRGVSRHAGNGNSGSGGVVYGSGSTAALVRLVVFVAVAVATVRSWGSPADFVKQFLFQRYFWWWWCMGVKRVVRFNLLGLFLVLACMALWPVPRAGDAAECILPREWLRNAGGHGGAAGLALLAWRQAGSGSGRELRDGADIAERIKQAR